MTPLSLDMIRRLAVETLNVPEPALDRARTLRDAGIDSLAALDLIFAVEGHFGISIAPQDVATMKSLADLALTVDRIIGDGAHHHVA